MSFIAPAFFFGTTDTQYEHRIHILCNVKIKLRFFFIHDFSVPLFIFLRFLTFVISLFLLVFSTLSVLSPFFLLVYLKQE